MPSRIRIGPDGGPYVIVEEDNGDVNISSPNGNVDFQNDDISNVDTLTATNGDIDSLSTDNLQGEYPGQIRAISGGTVVASIAPGSTTTGIQDAIDAINAETGGGTVFLPETVEQNGSITDAENISFIGSRADGSRINFTDLTADGMSISSNADGANTFWHNIIFDGVDKINRNVSTAAINFGRNLRRFDFGRVKFVGWDGNTHAGGGGVVDMTDAHAFSSHWQNVRFQSSGYSGHAFHVRSGGPGFTIANLYTGNDDKSVDIDANNAGGMSLGIGSWNIGGNTGEAAKWKSTGRASLRIGTLNYETGNSPATVLRLENSSVDRIWHGTARNSSPTDYVTIDGGSPGNKIIGRVRGFSTNAVNLAAPLTQPSWYFGNESDVSGSDVLFNAYRQPSIVRATRNSDSASTNSGTFTNAFGSEGRDERGEFNSSQQFVPDNDGEYEITASVVFGGSSAIGDTVTIRLFNVDTSSVVRVDNAAEVPQSNRGISFSFVYELSAGTAYELRVTNKDNSFVVGEATEAYITRVDEH